MKHLTGCLFCLLIGGSTSAYTDVRGDKLMDRYLNQSVRQDAVFSVAVDYTKPQQEPVRMEYTWMRKVRQGLISHLVRIESPPSEKGKLLLVHERANGETDHIAYRPNSLLKKKVAISSKRHYEYKGLSISVQELIGGELLKYSHQFKGTETIDGLTCDLVENRLLPQFKNDSECPASLIYFREDNGMPLKAELFGKPDYFKVIYFEEVRAIDGIWTVTRARIEDLKDKGQLVITLKEAHYNTDLKDDLFSEEYLKANSQD
jgi:outer membrane lipoprotein-sorting protein